MPSLPFRLERTTNRTSRATFQGDQILIRLAGRLSQMEEQRHINSLLKRMAKAHAKLQHTLIIDPFRTLLKDQTRQTVVFGDGSTTLIQMTPGKRTKAKIEAGLIEIERSAQIGNQAFGRLLWRAVAESECERIKALVHTVNQHTFNVPIKAVRLKFARSRWGSCSQNGRISLATPLLFLPPPLLEYVIIHELAHVLEHNHSKRFWQQVERVLPHYKDCVKAMRRYRLAA